MDELAQRPPGFIAPPDVFKSMNTRMQAFCQYYVLHNRNILRAGILAGYTLSASHGGIYQLFKRPDIQEGIAYYEELYATRAHYTAEKIIHEWSVAASFDISSLLKDDWSLKDLNKLPPDVREALKVALIGIEVVEKSNGSRTVKPKFDKSLAKQELGKLNKMYETQQGEAAHGMSLNITIGQQVNVAEHTTESIGHLTIDVEGQNKD